VYWQASAFSVAARLARRPGARLDALFVLQARQLTSDSLVAGLAWRWAGFGRYAWPAQACAGGAICWWLAFGLLIGLLRAELFWAWQLPAWRSALPSWRWGLRPRPADDPAASKLTSPGLELTSPLARAWAPAYVHPACRAAVALLVAALLGALLVCSP